LILEYIGIIPAAGSGLRASFNFPKELTVIPYREQDSNNPKDSLRVVIEFALECLQSAKIHLSYVVISEHKYSLISFLGDGSRYGLSLGYLYQNEALGLPSAIDCSYPFVQTKSLALVMPDTVIYPASSLREMLTFFDSRHEDIILGVFPTNTPMELCQVIYDDKFQISELLDKKPIIKAHNTWGLAAWRPRFSHFLHLYLKQKQSDRVEVTLAEVLEAALKKGLKLIAYPFSNATFMDIGTTWALRHALLTLSENTDL
jgi:glucose-1-phosphate thymidylyltransferase